MHPVAERQLAAWESLAEDWLVREDLPVLRCATCLRGVLLLRDPMGGVYLYTHEQELALTVLHLRNFHPDQDPNKPD